LAARLPLRRGKPIGAGLEDFEKSPMAVTAEEKRLGRGGLFWFLASCDDRRRPTE
jgi:hypothetical protein